MEASDVVSGIRISFVSGILPSLYSRSPGHRVPWWVLIWIKRSPLVFLVMSVACFSIGLCCFAYASNQVRAPFIAFRLNCLQHIQHHVTSTITTVFTAFTSFGLCAVSAWFASERWTFLRHSGRKWLSDVLLEGTDKFFNLPGMDMIRFCIHKFEKSLERMRSSISKVGIRTVSMMSHGSGNGSDDEKHDDIETGNGPILPLNSPPNSPTLKHRGTSDPLPETNGTISPTPTSPTTEGGAPSIFEEPSAGKQLWKNAIRTVKMRSAISSNIAAMASAKNPNRQRTSSSTLNGRKRSTGNGPLLRSRVATLTPQLRCLQPTRDLTAHQALVKHMQFSPNGKFLATSR